MGPQHLLRTAQEEGLAGLGSEQFEVIPRQGGGGCGCQFLNTLVSASGIVSQYPHLEQIFAFPLSLAVSMGLWPWGP